MGRLSIKQLEKKEYDGLQSSKLVLLIEGTDTSPALINSIRRASLLYVPSYAFNEENINIEKNDSVYNNDMMRLKISQLNLSKIDNDVIDFDDVYYSLIDDEELENQKDIRIYINVTNNTNNILNVTTNDIVYNEDGVEKQMFDKKYPHLITKLRENESFRCNAKAILGVGIVNDIWAAASNAYYEYDTEEDHKYILTLESQGQLDEYDIIDRCTGIMIDKLLILKQRFSTEYNTPDIEKKNTIVLTLTNEDATIGNILNYHLQEDNDIIYSGFSKPDHLQNKIVIKTISKELNPLIPIFKVIDHVIDVYNNFNTVLQKLGGKYITKH